ncbi:methyltransferase domain-containing protein [Aquibacillus sp. 3ASR75-11]|uniref:Methyltransferase domain-containing protein n=1 Tax=Terrihalobacillus insolitus TaxID=2950438 RepID=A0A9X3WR13_9BACI|nr:methyltransferase domain-containing protein [Terrihalobacillus insolitus]MDC3424497.1 methyltransferase domain-containing protein [Terrihalobacillus insolitus]
MEVNYTYTDVLAAFGVGGAHPGSLSLTKKTVKNLGINEQKRILDVGCGTGQTAAYIAETYDCHVTGLDPHQGMLDKMEQRLNDATLKVNMVQGEAEALPFDNQSFDIILSESVTSFTDAPQSLKEYARVLKRDGMLVMLEMTKKQDATIEDIDALKEFYGIKYILEEREWMTYLKEAGFHEVKVNRVAPLEMRADTEFDLLDDIDDGLFDIMARHQELIETYEATLGANMYFCKKAIK